MYLIFQVAEVSVTAMKENMQEQVSCCNPVVKIDFIITIYSDNNVLARAGISGSYCKSTSLRHGWKSIMECLSVV